VNVQIKIASTGKIGVHRQHPGKDDPTPQCEARVTEVQQSTFTRDDVTCPACQSGGNA